MENKNVINTQNTTTDEKENSGPRISVIMPAYNCAQTICQAVNSVRAQNVDWELIIINDRSPDNVMDVLKQYKDDSRIRIITNEENCGPAQSRNRGVTQAKGEYIAFLDSDDYWTSDKLSRQLQVMEETDCVLCCTARELVSTDGKTMGRVIPVDSELTYKKLLYGNQINCSSVLVKKEAMQKYPMSHSDSHEDYIAWLGILKEYGRAVGINEPMLKYRFDFSSKSGNKLKSAGMHYKALRYAGIGRVKALVYFCSYAIKGVLKYFA